jgi:hypothetical protein
MQDRYKCAAVHARMISSAILLLAYLTLTLFLSSDLCQELIIRAFPLLRRVASGSLFTLFVTVILIGKVVQCSLWYAAKQCIHCCVIVIAACSACRCTAKRFICIKAFQMQSSSH